jgi:hypothetical protein
MDGTYALRESGDAYRGHFAVENEALGQKTRFSGTQLLKFRELGVVRPAPGRSPRPADARIAAVLETRLLQAQAVFSTRRRFLRLNFGDPCDPSEGVS